MSIRKKILCIIGHSGSGKTTIENMLACAFPSFVNRIVSYTTRPMREGEKDGREHWFVSPDKAPVKNNMLAYTRYGDYEYWADPKDLVDDKLNVYVIDVEGYRYLKHFFGEQYDIKVLYVKRSVRNGIDLQRQQRDKGRMMLEPDEIDCVLRNEGDMDALFLNLVRIDNYLFGMFYEKLPWEDEEESDKS